MNTEITEIELAIAFIRDIRIAGMSNTGFAVLYHARQHLEDRLKAMLA